MIGRRKPRVACREQRLQQLQSPWRTGLYEPVPAEIPRRQIPGVELGQPAHVERDAVLGPRPTEDFSFPYRVLGGVLRHAVVRYVQYERRLGRALQVPHGGFDVDEPQHLVRFDPGVYVRAREVRMDRLPSRGVELYPVDLGVEPRQKGVERLPRPRRGGDELRRREGAPRVVVSLPTGDLVENVALHLSVPLVDGDVPVPAYLFRLPVPLAPAHAEGVPLRLRLVEVHHRTEVFFVVGPETTLLGAGLEVGGLEPVLDGLGGELVAEDPVEGVGEGRE